MDQTNMKLTVSPEGFVNYRFPCLKSLYALVFALSFIAVAIFSSSSWAGIDSAAALAEKKAAIISNLHKKAAKALVNAAQDPVFKEYFSGDKSAKSRIDKLSLSVQSRFNVDEMCLIDEKGHEISRIVASDVAPEADLSTEEASAPFFAPAFAKKVKEVFVSPAYISPDALKWVVAYVTPVENANQKVAILHYEHGLEIFQATLNTNVSGDTVVLLVDSDGYVLSDSRRHVNIAIAGENEERPTYFKKIYGGLAEAIQLGKEGTAMFSAQNQHYVAAYKPIEDWTIVVIEKP